MLIPNKFNGYRADGRRVYPIGGGVGEAMLLGAAMSGGSAAITGGDPLKGALLGGLTGGIGSGISGALAGAPEAATLASTTNAPASLLSSQTAGTALNNLSAYTPVAMPATSTAATGIESLVGSQAPGVAMNNLSAFSQAPGITSLAPPGGIPGAMPVGSVPMLPSAGANAASLFPDISVGQSPASIFSAAPTPADLSFTPTAAATPTVPVSPAMPVASLPTEVSAVTPTTTQPAVPVNAQPNLFKDPTAYIKAHPYLAGSSALAGALGGRREMEKPGEYEGPLKRFRFDPSTYRPGFADGGIAALPAGYDRMVGEAAAYPKFAQGGISDLGSYSDGGRMLRGPGDGMSDNIPGVIAGKRPARLADGEFVVPADVVSHLGNGSTDAGARQLYTMMDKVRKARTGRKAQGREINPRRYMPA